MVWFGKYADIASLVLPFGFTNPAYVVLTIVHCGDVKAQLLDLVLQFFKPTCLFETDHKKC